MRVEREVLPSHVIIFISGGHGLVPVVLVLQLSISINKSIRLRDRNTVRPINNIVYYCLPFFTQTYLSVSQIQCDITCLRCISSAEMSVGNVHRIEFGRC